MEESPKTNYLCIEVVMPVAWPTTWHVVGNCGDRKFS